MRAAVVYFFPLRTPEGAAGFALGEKDMLIKEYAIPVIFILANLAIPFYKVPSILNSILYILSFVFLYASFFDGSMQAIAIIVYGILSASIMRWNMGFIYVVAANIFICEAVIKENLFDYNIPGVYVNAHSKAYDYDSISTMICEAAGLELFFLLGGCILFIIVKTRASARKKMQS